MNPLLACPGPGLVETTEAGVDTLLSGNVESTDGPGVTVVTMSSSVHLEVVRSAG